MHADVQVEEISNAEEETLAEKKNQDPIIDLKHFFKEVPRSSGDKKAKVKCECCEWVLVLTWIYYPLILFIFESRGQGCRKQESILGYDHTTLRRHMAAKHKVRFLYLYFLFYHLFLPDKNTRMNIGLGAKKETSFQCSRRTPNLVKMK